MVNNLHFKLVIAFHTLASFVTHAHMADPNTTLHKAVKPGPKSGPPIAKATGSKETLPFKNRDPNTEKSLSPWSPITALGLMFDTKLG